MDKGVKGGMGQRAGGAGTRDKRVTEGAREGRERGKERMEGEEEGKVENREWTVEERSIEHTRATPPSDGPASRIQHSAARPAGGSLPRATARLEPRASKWALSARPKGPGAAAAAHHLKWRAGRAARKAQRPWK